MGKLNFELDTSSKRKKGEVLKLKPHGISARLQAHTGKSGDYFVSIMPSINTSGYGSTEREALDDLKYNINVFFEYLFSLKESSRILELRKLGWEKHNFFKKRYSKAFVDEKGILQNFDNPLEVKSQYLQAV